MNGVFHMYGWISISHVNNGLKILLKLVSKISFAKLYMQILIPIENLNYRLFKNKFEFENYFNILDDKNIFTFCRFRQLNNRTLPCCIQHGRWNNILRELRIWNLWNTEDLENEFHYLLKCDYFNEKRKTCIDKNILKIIIFWN